MKLRDKLISNIIRLGILVYNKKKKSLVGKATKNNNIQTRRLAVVEYRLHTPECVKIPISSEAILFH